MSWPTPQQYQEAFQNPRLAFKQPELQSARPTCDKHGFPQPISGNFASVYRMTKDSEVFAIRCFLREQKDQQTRYAAIHRALNRAKLPYTVNFEFISDGIRVNSKWYPMLKMEWVKGRSLIDYVSRNLTKPGSLELLAAHWVKMLQDLQRVGIAHGDLQHGNVLVVDGKLKLIDYDGMFVDELSGKTSHELGHRNYQHPNRSPNDFDKSLDNFSGWVIYLSLLALSVRPSLFTDVSGGDENILLRQKDFQNPSSSHTLRLIEQTNDPKVLSVLKLFRSLLDMSPADVPPLSSVATIVQPNYPVPNGPTKWWVGHLDPPGENPPSGGPGIPKIQAPIGSHWVIDIIGNSEDSLPLNFTTPPVLAKAVLYGSIFVSAYLFLCLLANIGYWMVFLPMILGVLLLGSTSIYAFYKHNPTIAAYRSLQVRLRAVTESAASISSEQLAYDEKIRNIELERAKNTNELQAKLAALKMDEQAELAKAAQGLQRMKDRLGTVPGETAAKMKAINRDADSRVLDIRREIDNLALRKLDRLSSELRKVQEHHVNEYLRGCYLSTASINGIGPAYTKRLQSAGFHTALDIDRRALTVVGIGQARYSELTMWQDNCKRLAQKTRPKSLSVKAANDIETVFRRDLEELNTRLRVLEIHRNRDIELAESEIKRKVLEIEMEIGYEETAVNERQRRISLDYNERRQRLMAEKERLDRNATEARKSIEESKTDLKRRHWSANWESAQLQAQLSRYANLSFARFFGILTGFR